MSSHNHIFLPSLSSFSCFLPTYVSFSPLVPPAFTGFETSNKYKVQNSMGQKIYFAAEDTDCCTRNCCGPLRPFDMKILDNSQNEVIHLNRPLACTSCFFPCCLQVSMYSGLFSLGGALIIWGAGPQTKTKVVVKIHRISVLKTSSWKSQEVEMQK